MGGFESVVSAARLPNLLGEAVCEALIESHRSQRDHNGGKGGEGISPRILLVR